MSSTDQDTVPTVNAVKDELVSKHLTSYVDDRQPGSFFAHPPPPQHASDPGKEPFMSWDYVVSTLTHGDLDQLFRDPACDSAYRTFAPPVRAQYGGLENYIRQVRLGWPAEASPANLGPNMLDKPQKDVSTLLSGGGSGKSTPSGARTPLEKVKETWPEKTLPHPRNSAVALRHFVADAEVEDNPSESLVRVIPNDWPYGVPRGCTHWVVWSKLPVLHPSLFDASPFPHNLVETLYECVTGDGIRGFTGFTPSSDSNPVYSFQGKPIPQIVGSYSQSKLEHGGVEGLNREIISQAHAWASRQVVTYITAKWKPQDGFQTGWFCNPPNLRTVPGLSHFHVIVRHNRTA